MFGVCVRVCVHSFSAVSKSEQHVDRPSSTTHTPPTPVFPLPPVCLSPPLPFRTELELIQHPHYRRLGPKMAPTRLLLMLAPVSHHSQLCAQSLKAWFDFAKGMSYYMVVSIPPFGSTFCHWEAKYLIFSALALSRFSVIAQQKSFLSLQLYC